MLRSTRRAYSTLSAVFLACVLAGACMPDVQKEPDQNEPRVHPVFDTEAETIPLPNDAALDAQGTVPDLEGHEGDGANGTFLRWLSSLHGWLTSTPIEIQFDGRLRKQTVEPSAVRLYRVKSDESLERLDVASLKYMETKVTVGDGEGGTERIDGSRVTVVPKSVLTHETEYAVVVTDAIEDANGNAVVEPQPIFFAASEEPLVDENGDKTVESLPNDRTARQLEQLRKSLQPVFEGFEQRNQKMDRTDVATAFRWTTVRDPQTIVRPETATLPLPNDAALEDDGTFPKAALDHVEEQSAQGHFERYLDRLHGWPPPPQTPITLPIGGPIDPSTVGTQQVQVWRYDPDAGSVTRVDVSSVGYDAEEGVIEVTPKDALPKRTQYIAFATDEIEDDDGFSLKPAVAMKMALQPDPLVENGESTVPRLSDDQAAQIEALQSSLRPPVEAIMEQTDLEIEDFGAFWRWTNWTDTFAVFDPGAGEVPFPNDIVRQGQNGRVSLPTQGLSGLQKDIVEELNRRRGFSTTASGWVTFDGPVESGSISRSSAPLLWQSGVPSLYEPSRYELDYRSSWNRLLVQPTVPLNRDTERDPTAAGKLNIGVVTKEMTGGNGHPVMPAPAFVFVRSPHPLYEDGSSTVEQLSDSEAQQLEQVRSAYERLFFALNGIGGLNIDGRTDVSLAYPWHPENSVQPLQEFRAQALDRVGARTMRDVRRACETSNCSSDPNAVVNPGSNYQGPDGAGPAVDMSNVQRIQWAAEYQTVRFLKSDGTMSDYGDAAPTSVGISVFLPKTGGQCSRPFQVVVAQHGLGSHRVELGMALANELAGECLAVVAADFPRHGGRAPGATSLHPDSNPSSSGQGFLTAELRRTKNTLFQSAIDMTVLAQLVQNDSLEAAIDLKSGTDYFAYGSDNEIGYIGQSLGGFIGIPATTVDSNFSVAVFNAAGGGYADVLSDGSLGGNILQKLQQAGLQKGTFDRFRALSFIQWVAEPIDPLTFAPYLQEIPASEKPNDTPTDIHRGPLTELVFEQGSGYSTGNTLPSNEVLIQMATDPSAGDDRVVPNATTERLAESAELSVGESTYGASHGFLTETDTSSDDYDAGDCARRQAAAWLASGLSGEASFDPSLKPSNCTSN